MKEFTLNDEDMQSLKTSLITFVKRIAFQGTDSEEEAGAFVLIVNLLLGNPVALELNLDDLSGKQEEEAEPDDYGYYGDGIIEPPYKLNWLARLPEHSNMLGQCIEAMETNIDGFGFTLEPAFECEEGNEAAEAERKTLLHFFEFCNFELPYSQLRRRVRRDIEVLGNGYWEVIRDGKGDIVWLEHIEGHTMRLTQLDREYTPVTYLIRDDESNELQDTLRARGFGGMCRYETAGGCTSRSSETLA